MPLSTPIYPVRWWSFHKSVVDPWYQLTMGLVGIFENCLGLVVLSRNLHMALRAMALDNFQSSILQKHKQKKIEGYAGWTWRVGKVVMVEALNSSFCRSLTRAYLAYEQVHGWCWWSFPLSLRREWCNPKPAASSWWDIYITGRLCLE